jgi:shikimate kinase
MTKLIILRGYPGSGKTTIGKRLETEGLGKFIDHNAILTFIAGITGDDEGIYDEIADLELAMCKKLLGEGKNTIIARGFSSLASLQPYETITNSLGIEAKILRLSVDKDELMRRVQSHERKLDFNPTTDEAHALKWMNDNPLQDHPDEIVIDNLLPIDTVIDTIKTII